MERYKIIPLIFILYYIILLFIRDISCVKFDELQSLTSITFNHPNTYDDYKDYKIYYEKKLKESNFNSNSKELVKHIRNARGISESSRYLRPDDAHQVANYFLTGGPLKGHSHFVRERNCNSESEKNKDEISNSTNKSNIDSSVNEQNLNITSSDSIVGAPHLPTLHSHNLHSLLHPTLNTLSRVPQLLLGNNLLHSVLHPNLHPHINALHEIPSSLMKSATLPLNDLIHARSELRNILHPDGPLLGNINKALEGHTKKRKNLKNTLIHPFGQYTIVGLAPKNFHNNIPLSKMIEPHLSAPHPHPNGYIVKYIAHNKQSKL
ncbi:uncharacterized protein LOC102676151 [Apis dorsata]|uniref:uncharacterized protein LOC102676151 n=1 Tax=Apis dorsata TaxID=7462 RepID=UPI001293FA54|nr:uncharacterized protein LOC102676151 [Apis dorsata]XP_031367884.1 uncharacterized protein LOC102676151 [Apis dorsata]